MHQHGYNNDQKDDRQKRLGVLVAGSDQRRTENPCRGRRQDAARCDPRQRRERADFLRYRDYGMHAMQSSRSG
ncbi:hypothetical protein [Desulfopila inferna]|uniref:hypothetical protein n=1 Tax=Desulfopila inferna TaxID=468528 RepID=UPI00196560DA|nr:hypothetical protein [Desulfopila inferna]MBM9606526.1 hypothetical protein [Desulfopila inferna]